VRVVGNHCAWREAGCKYRKGAGSRVPGGGGEDGDTGRRGGGTESRCAEGEAGYGYRKLCGTRVSASTGADVLYKTKDHYASCPLSA